LGFGRTASAVTHNTAETEDAGASLASSLSAGDVVLLYGDLGAGKTAFVRGLARGLSADPDTVSSPTFVILQQYRGRVPLYHADLYRLSGADVADLGLDEVAADGVLAVEWAERMTAPPTMAVIVRIEDLGGDDRRLTIDRRATGEGNAEPAEPAERIERRGRKDGR
jgi:tRNA threonylcarbamoyladenosine biosynthesis protein TsaE